MINYYVEIFMHIDKSYLSKVSRGLEVLSLSLWRYSFELINKELEITRKKKQALDNLFAERKISQSTYDYLQSELEKAISELENNLRKLKERMATRVQELESQRSSLELLLASLEIHHAAGDVSDEIYEKENKAILLGIEATNRELNDIRNALEAPSREPVAEQSAETGETVMEKAEAEVVEAEKPSVESEQTAVSYEELPTEESVEEQSSESPKASKESSVEESSSTYSEEPSSFTSWETESPSDY